MVMGPTHSMSGAAAWLSVTALTGAVITGVNIDNLDLMALPVLLMGTFICAGAALAPDIDSHSSTVVNSFGIFGRLGYMLANWLSLLAFETTKTKHDNNKENGHRTLFHTGIMALVAGGLVYFLGGLENEINIASKTFHLGQIFSLITMFIFSHLALAGLFEKWIKSRRKKYGPYVMMLFSLATTILIAYFLPEEQNYPWLGISVTVGWFMHILGDLITKLGVPLLWPLKIRGKRWWSVSLPSFMRIKAGGQFEKAVLLPVLTLLTIVLSIYLFPGVKELLST